jgi:Aminotransferase class-V
MAVGDVLVGRHLQPGPAVISRAGAAELDVVDPLGGFRDAFLPLADSGVVAYLDGNSLGRPPAATLDRLIELVRDQWGTRLIRSWWWDGWFELPRALGDELGAAALGAAPGQVIFGDSTTVWLYKLLRAALAARPGRREIVTNDDNFPTDRYVVEGVAAELGCTVRWLRPDPAAGVTVEQVRAAVGPDTAVVTLSHVAYRSAFLADMSAITSAVHEAGALTVWDLCHSVGAVPVEDAFHGQQMRHAPARELVVQFGQRLGEHVKVTTRSVVNPSPCLLDRWVRLVRPGEVTFNALKRDVQASTAQQREHGVVQAGRPERGLNLAVDRGHRRIRRGHAW